MNPFETYDGSKYRKRFYDALKLYRNSDYEGALAILCEIVAEADVQDVYHNKYRSYEGLTRVCLGDKHAVELCRETAAEGFGYPSGLSRCTAARRTRKLINRDAARTVAAA